ncbi:PREDICTED: uncharacterized protein LOC104806615 [Tarenaya hassleriana]|uniref:uncharacterized protein LOC104806615 n=1 Tax=Tarenaya hassleriana TaxID=28532 RepID=UPI00053C96E2|nr:PREDICTED: uncharacterized protein LOC104806615 [Tarenaya hassleriana]
MKPFLAVEATMDANRSRRLNFNARLLSTKRHVGEEKDVLEASSGSEGIPFCWETVPGLPKNLSLKKDDGLTLESDTPRLKLPPGRLKVKVNGEENGRNKTDNREAMTAANLCLKTPEETQQNNLEGSNQDAVEVLSLTQAIDMVEHQTNPKSGGSGYSNGYFTVDTTGHSSDLSDPSYIIERFLPDAAALAAVTSSAAKKPTSKNNSSSRFGNLWSGQSKRSAFAFASPSPKGCGLHVLLPTTWGARHRICGMKTAFSPCSHIDLQPRFAPKEK